MDGVEKPRPCTALLPCGRECKKPGHANEDTMHPFRLRSPSVQPALALTKPPAPKPLTFGLDNPPTGKPGGTDEENAAARDELIARGQNAEMLKALGVRRKA